MERESDRRRISTCASWKNDFADKKKPWRVFVQRVPKRGVVREAHRWSRFHPLLELVFMRRNIKYGISNVNQWQFCNRKITDGYTEKEKEEKSKRMREGEREKRKRRRRSEEVRNEKETVARKVQYNSLSSFYSLPSSSIFFSPSYFSRSN